VGEDLREPHRAVDVPVAIARLVPFVGDCLIGRGAGDGSECAGSCALPANLCRGSASERTIDRSRMCAWLGCNDSIKHGAPLENRNNYLAAEEIDGAAGAANQV